MSLGAGVPLTPDLAAVIEPELARIRAPLGERTPSDESYKERTPGWARHFVGGAVLTHTAMDPNNPFWVVQATKQVIDGHNGIFGDVFLGFIRKLVAEQLR